MAELANRIARNERGGTGVGEIERNGSRRRRRVHDGRGSSVFSSANVDLVLQSASGAMQLQGFRAEKGNSAFKTSTYSVVPEPFCTSGECSICFPPQLCSSFRVSQVKGRCGFGDHSPRLGMRADSPRNSSIPSSCPLL